MKTQVSEFIQAALDPQSKIIAVIGVCKNAGKTTLLNWLLQQAGEGMLGVLTTGRDGEDIDLVTHEAKPKVVLPPNTMFSTFAEEIEKNTPYLTVLEKLPFKAGGRNLWLVRTTRELQVEIVGPASAEAQLKLARHMLSLGAIKVFIDGSLDRKAISLQEGLDALILVISPAMGDERSILDEVKRLYELSTLPTLDEQIPSDYISFRKEESNWEKTPFKSLLSREKEFIQYMDMVQDISAIYLLCPVTDKGFATLKSFLHQFKGELVLRHPYLLHLSLSNLKWLRDNCRLKVLNPFKLKAIAVNSYSTGSRHMPSDQLRAMIRSNVKEIPIIDVKEII